jgi:CheY-like chemotaxis protein
MATSEALQPDLPVGASVADVLVVDDSEGIRDSLAELLQDEGYVVETAANGIVALERLRSGLRPRAILLDLIMPGMNGWEFRFAQLAEPALKAIPVVVMTASGFAGDSLKTELGGVELMSKPLAPEALLDMLRRLPPR